MKLCSWREYTHDLSDIVGILREQKEKEHPIGMEDIDAAVVFLYGSWDRISATAKEELKVILENIDDTAKYNQVREKELQTRERLVEFGQSYPDVLSEDNLAQIISQLSTNQKNTF